MPQCHRFHDGSFVLHNLPIDGRKYSAWFNADGTLKDAERTVSGQYRTYPVQERHTNIRARLANIGRVWKTPRADVI